MSTPLTCPICGTTLLKSADGRYVHRCPGPRVMSSGSTKATGPSSASRATDTDGSANAETPESGAAPSQQPNGADTNTQTRTAVEALAEQFEVQRIVPTGDREVVEVNLPWLN